MSVPRKRKRMTPRWKADAMSAGLLGECVWLHTEVSKLLTAIRDFHYRLEDEVKLTPEKWGKLEERLQALKPQLRDIRKSVQTARTYQNRFSKTYNNVDWRPDYEHVIVKERSQPPRREEFPDPPKTERKIVRSFRGFTN